MLCTDLEVGRAAARGGSALRAGAARAALYPLPALQPATPSHRQGRGRSPRTRERPVSSSDVLALPGLRPRVLARQPLRADAGRSQAASRSAGKWGLTPFSPVPRRSALG